MSTQYTFRLDNFRIDNTRSRHEDTDFVSVSLAVGARPPQTQSRAMGDLNNGTFDVGLVFDNISVADNETAVFTYAIVNSGHTDPSAAENILMQATAKVAQVGAQAAATAVGEAIGVAAGAAIGTAALPVIGTALGALAGWLVGEAGNLIFTNCDGAVAAGMHPLTGAQLRAATAGGNALQQSDDNPGTDSNSGCGSNSQYIVNWSVTFISEIPEQADWRFCSKCSALFFDGFPEQGVCPAGGAHDKGQSFNFVLKLI